VTRRRTAIARVSSAGPFAERIGGTRWATAAIAASVLAFWFLIQWRWPRAPGPLLALLLAAGCVGAFGLSRRGVVVADRIPAGWPAPTLPDINPGDLRDLLLPAFAVFVVGFSDMVLTARAFARRGIIFGCRQIPPARLPAKDPAISSGRCRYG
jgi:sulfate permease, SulP family